MYINIHTHHGNRSNIKAIRNLDINTPSPLNEDQLYSTGIHPWHISDNLGPQLEQLHQAVIHPNAAAIGECGLDKVNGPAIDIQIKAFTAQVELSESLQKPLIIHCVKAYSEIIHLRKKLQPTQAWIFHGFNASPETMKQAARLGFYFSYGAALMNPKSKAVKSFVLTPTERLFLETDDQTEYSIELIFNKASELIKTDITPLQQIILNNFSTLF